MKARLRPAIRVLAMGAALVLASGCSDAEAGDSGVDLSAAPADVATVSPDPVPSPPAVGQTDGDLESPVAPSPTPEPVTPSDEDTTVPDQTMGVCELDSQDGHSKDWSDDELEEFAKLAEPIAEGWAAAWSGTYSSYRPWVSAIEPYLTEVGLNTVEVRTEYDPDVHGPPVSVQAYEMCLEQVWVDIVFEDGLQLKAQIQFDVDAGEFLIENVRNAEHDRRFDPLGPA